MPRYICKVANDDQAWYLEWSTVVDAPVSYGMSLEEFKEFYREEYGNQGLGELEERLKRVEQKGTSSMMHDSVNDLIANNRAGKKETQITKDQIIAYYCTEELENLPYGVEWWKENNE
jgi:hypothetical protein